MQGRYSLTETKSILGTCILPKRWQRTAVNLLVGGFHTKHSFSAIVSLLRQVVDYLRTRCELKEHVNSSSPGEQKKMKTRKEYQGTQQQTNIHVDVFTQGLGENRKQRDLMTNKRVNLVSGMRVFSFAMKSSVLAFVFIALERSSLANNILNWWMRLSFAPSSCGFGNIRLVGTLGCTAGHGLVAMLLLGRTPRPQTVWNHFGRAGLARGIPKTKRAKETPIPSTDGPKIERYDESQQKQDGRYRTESENSR